MALVDTRQHWAHPDVIAWPASGLQRRHRPLFSLFPGQPAGGGRVDPRLHQAHLHAAPGRGPRPYPRPFLVLRVISHLPATVRSAPSVRGRASVCLSAGAGRPLSCRKTSPPPAPGSPPAAPLTMLFPTEAIGTATGRPLPKVLPTHLSPLSSAAIVVCLLPPVPTAPRAPGLWLCHRGLGAWPAESPPDGAEKGARLQWG